MDTLAALTALLERTRTLGLREDLEALLDDVLRCARELIEFEHCGLLLFDAEHGELVVRRVLGFGAEAARFQDLRIPLGWGLTGWAAANRQPVRVGDVTLDPRYLPGLTGARSDMAVPLIAGNELVGVMNVESTRLDAFSEEHEKLLTVLGTHAALAIEASRSRERLEQRLAQRDALYRISQLAAHRHDVDVTLGEVLAILEEIVPFGYVAILLPDPTTRALSVRCSRGHAPEADAARIPPGSGVTGRCALTGQVQLVDDVGAVPDYVPGVPGARSELALPLLADGQLIGVLNFESREPGAYGQDHVRTLSVVAHQVAVVLRAAQLNEEARRLAVTDSLTGLHNRRCFMQELEERLKRARRYGETLAVVFVDLDGFKPINDGHGHGVGDQALQAVAGAMRAWIRDSDAIGRIGGDEFAAVLLQAERQTAWQVVDRLRLAVAGLEVRGRHGEPVPVTLSAGIALFPEDATELETLLVRADVALLEAKRQGRNRVVLAPPPA